MDNLQAVFIDRDGTIGGTGHFIHPRDFTPYPFTEEALKLLKAYGIRTFACTNQHRISKGEAGLEDFVNEFKIFGFEDAFICPHGSSEGCECRKPSPGLLREAAEKHRLDLTKTAFIGDVGSTDMLAADAVGAKKILVLTGWGEGSLTQYRHKWADIEPDYIAENLLDAVKWLLHK
ncbi:HAD-IIIA family hydrolase [Sporosarcina thermotolerans]|uniref:D,D-heptose 1,7-bisphosphate phosphatase n=1 Tax=Sporosarcina thermotolerans TaxID=633404 RepID=A0AAW9ACY3_9BACL|nr:HAD-IIIA family hydrolase [Sporosarcina thermotolerans]MDW0118805.1 HAD-IIIA family hydrolase [Sporosarcina thermotolerans]WHT48494.1 HAD-IIIA family hydrolase [Sporosarcina thermotolerans]